MKTNPVTAKRNLLTIFSDKYLEGRNQLQRLGKLPLRLLTYADKPSCQWHDTASPGRIHTTYFTCFLFYEIPTAHAMARLLSVRLSKNQDTFDDHRPSGLEPL